MAVRFSNRQLIVLLCSIVLSSTIRSALALPSKTFLAKIPTLDKSGEIHPMALTYVGTVDGKSFFSDNTVTRNWIEASAFCKSANLKLASVETEGQFRLLRDNIGSPNTYFWIAGRESRLPSSFIWDGAGTSLNMNAVKEFGSYFVSKVDYQLCLMIGSKDIPRPKQGIEMYHCSTKLKGTLCQT